jgi:type VI secretion system secreted protein VgrG
MPEDATKQMALVTSPELPLQFKSMSALEEISRLFEYQIIAISESNSILADDILGKTVAVSLEIDDSTKRWFNGVVTGFGIEGQLGRFYTYRLTARPWIWLMTRSSNIRIFQNLSTPDIIKQVFGDYSGTVTDSLSGSYSPRVYCVQYRETDFNFVCRLMEEEGIYFFFKHAQDKHELVLADDGSAIDAAPGLDHINYNENENDWQANGSINAWRMRHEIQTGQVVLRDYNFETPSTDLKSEPATSTRSHDEKDHEVYDYPGLYGVKADGDARALIRIDEASSRFGRFTGEGNSISVVTGTRFTLADHPRDDQNAEYLVLQTQIDMEIATYEAEGDVDLDTKFLCRLVAQPFADPFRPQRTTRKPTVAGPQTAIVVGGGDAGDIETDKYGRVKVQFHWDRVGTKDADSSCWIRVASGWAGNGWGFISLPRIGQEVVVTFLEGDPDQPLVVGSVHNEEQLPPYELPAKANIATFKSRSIKGATDAFNEVRFDDTPGSEYVLMQAQKDQHEFVEGTVKGQIGIGDGEGDEHRTVKKDRKEKIGGEHHLYVVKDAKYKYDLKYSLAVKEDMMIAVDKTFSLKSKEDWSVESVKQISLNATKDIHVKTAANYGVEATQNVYLKGMNVVIEAATQLSLVVGGSCVVIDSSGVSVVGPTVKVNSGGSAGSGTAPSPVAPTAPDAPTDPDLPEDPLTHR